MKTSAKCLGLAVGL